MKRCLQLIVCLLFVLNMVTVCTAGDVLKIGVLQALPDPLNP